MRPVSSHTGIKYEIKSYRQCGYFTFIQRTKLRLTYKSYLYNKWHTFSPQIIYPSLPKQVNSFFFQTFYSLSVKFNSAYIQWCIYINIWILNVKTYTFFPDLYMYMYNITFCNFILLLETGIINTLLRNSFLIFI